MEEVEIMDAATILRDVSFSKIAAECSDCAAGPACLTHGLAPLDLQRIKTLLSMRFPVRAGKHLYRAGSPLKSLHVITEGCFKTSATLEDGREQVIGFGLPGETLGTDAIAANKHLSDTVALEDSVVCAVPFAELQQLGRESQCIERNICRVMSAEISRHHKIMLLLGGMRGDERLASFLLDLSERNGTRGVPGPNLILPMTRADIGSYLGLKVETVSRMFAQLHRAGAIEVHGRCVTIRSLGRLKAVAAGNHGFTAEVAPASEPPLTVVKNPGATATAH